MANAARIGIIGNGGFTDFLIRAWATVTDVEVTALAARDAARLNATAEKYGLQNRYSGPDGWKEMLADTTVDVVAIVTPPSLHAEMAIAAIEAGKAILCEKPLATTVEDGERILAAARAHNAVAGINYVMRYNPLFHALKTVVEEGVLGGLHRVDFTNLASDEWLPPDHWFWDVEQSGGILVEHGVHFFDVYGWLIGSLAKDVQGYRTVRPGTTQEDRVLASVLYENGALGTYYHAFDRPSRLESQRALLSFDQGTIEVEGWIAITAKVDAAVSEAQESRLIALLTPNSSAEREAYPPARQLARGGGNEYQFDARLRYESRFAPDQGTMYEQNVRDALSDVAAKWRDPSHVLKANIEDGLESLWVACAVERIEARG